MQSIQFGVARAGRLSKQVAEQIRRFADGGAIETGGG
jgi:hypothetical protein